MTSKNKVREVDFIALSNSVARCHRQMGEAIEQFAPLVVEALRKMRADGKEWRDISMELLGSEASASSLAKMMKGKRKPTAEVVIALGLSTTKKRRPPRKPNGVRLLIALEDAKRLIDDCSDEKLRHRIETAVTRLSERNTI